MLLDAPGRPLRLAEVPDPEPSPDQLLIEVRACGVCRTDLHLVDGDLEVPRTPVLASTEEVERFLDRLTR